MKILVVNAGSSSLKYQLIDMDGEKELATAPEKRRPRFPRKFRIMKPRRS